MIEEQKERKYYNKKKGEMGGKKVNKRMGRNQEKKGRKENEKLE